MADNIVYTGADIAEAAAAFRMVNDNLDGTWGELSSAGAELETMWQGDAATAFFEAFNQLICYKDQVKAIIEGIYQFLEIAKEEMEAVDEANANMISSI